jgi:3-deoxy-D-manno-octulosonic acid hydroxylase-like protein
VRANLFALRLPKAIPADGKTMVEVSDYNWPDGWLDTAASGLRSTDYCERLERGDILYFENPPFDLADAQRDFLLSQRQTNSRYHKNISFRPATDKLRGTSGSRDEIEKLRSTMRSYSKSVFGFVTRFLTPYADKLTLDFASFRPFEEESRDLPLHKRNDLLHVDSFPTRPTSGKRILRVFTNIERRRPRVWNTGQPFDVIARTLAEPAGLQRFVNSSGGAGRLIRKLVRTTGIVIPQRSAYDRFMLRFHDYLKENEEYQRNCLKTRTEFAPGSTWLAFTDGVPHAVLSGRFALEQTFLVAVEALVVPEVSPLRTLESLCGKSLA